MDNTDMTLSLTFQANSGKKLKHLQTKIGTIDFEMTFESRTEFNVRKLKWHIIIIIFIGITERKQLKPETDCRA